MNLEIITPDKKLYEGQANLVQLPGSDGSFEILNNHAPLIATLKAGKVKVEEASTKNVQSFDIKGGVIEVLSNKVIVLAE